MGAETLLGPDGKRCKKCNPIVVDLTDNDGSGRYGRGTRLRLPVGAYSDSQADLWF